MLMFSTRDVAKYTGKTRMYINRLISGNLLKDLDLHPTKVGEVWIFNAEDTLKLAKRYSPDKGYVELKKHIEKHNGKC